MAYNIDDLLTRAKQLLEGTYTIEESGTTVTPETESDYATSGGYDISLPTEPISPEPNSPQVTSQKVYARLQNAVENYVVREEWPYLYINEADKANVEELFFESTLRLWISQELGFNSAGPNAPEAEIDAVWAYLKPKKTAYFGRLKIIEAPEPEPGPEVNESGIIAEVKSEVEYTVQSLAWKEENGEYYVDTSHKNTIINYLSESNLSSVITDKLIENYPFLESLRSYLNQLLSSIWTVIEPYVEGFLNLIHFKDEPEEVSVDISYVADIVEETLIATVSDIAYKLDGNIIYIHTEDKQTTLDILSDDNVKAIIRETLISEYPAIESNTTALTHFTGSVLAAMIGRRTDLRARIKFEDPVIPDEEPDYEAGALWVTQEGREEIYSYNIGDTDETIEIYEKNEARVNQLLSSNHYSDRAKNWLETEFGAGSWTLVHFSKLADKIGDVLDDLSQRIVFLHEEEPSGKYYKLAITVVGNGTTTPLPGEYKRSENSTMTVEAIPDTDWKFSHWMLENERIETQSVSVNFTTNQVLQANFKEVDNPYNPDDPDNPDNPDNPIGDEKKDWLVWLLIGGGITATALIIYFIRKK
jgi:hypothetical protein